MSRRAKSRPRRLPASYFALLASPLLFASQYAHAAAVSWAVNADGQWTTASNWSTNVLPVTTDDVTISQPGSIIVTLSSGNQSINNLITDNNLTLSGGNLSVTGISIFRATTTLSGGNLISPIQIVGQSGNGTLTQSTGTNTASSYVSIGDQLTGNGTYNLSGGDLFTDYLGVGRLGTGSFTQTGGNVTLTSYFAVADQANAVGNYSLSGTSTLTAGYGYVGSLGHGNFTQNGGAVSTSAYLVLGNLPGGVGNYNLTAGTLGTPYLAVGLQGNGTFAASSGAITLTDHFSLGDQVGSNGNLSLSGNASLSTPVGIIGSMGNGTFTQNGGTANIADILSIADQVGSTGNYNLSAGDLAVAGAEQIATTGNATFTHTGGNNTLGPAATLTIGFVAGSNGFYNLSGTGNLTANSFEVIGHSGNGTFTQSAGLNNITGGALFLGDNSIANGIYNLDGGTLQTAAGINEYIGNFGTGNVTQTAGFNTLGPGASLRLGSLAGSSGTYNLSGTGTLTATFESIGAADSGNFKQNGGTNTVNGGGLFVGDSTGSSGTYLLTAGSLITSAFTNEYVGNLGSGTFNQNGGNNTLGPSSLLIISALSGSNGFYTLIGGNLTLTAGSISVGQNAGASGHFNISTASAVATNLYVGGSDSAPGGTGSVILNAGGILNLTGSLVVYNTTSTAFNLSGGSLSVSSINLNGNNSHFRWNTGSLQFNNSITFDSAASPNSTSVIFGSALTLGAGQSLFIAGDETLGGTGPFALTINAGSTHVITGNLTINSNGALTQSGPTTLVLANLTNSGNFVHTSGNISISGNILNNATGNLSLNGNFSNSVNNLGTIIVPTGNLTLSGSVPQVSGTSLSGSWTVNTFSALVISSAPTITTLTGNVTLSGANSNFIAINALTTLSGTFSILGGRNFSTAGNLTSSGQINIGAGSTFTVTGQYSPSGSASITGTGNFVTTIINTPTVAVTDATVTLGAGFAANNVSLTAGSLTVLDQNPPPGQDPELNRSIVAGYLTNGNIAINSGNVTTPILKLGISPGKTGNYTQTGGNATIGLLAIGDDASLANGAGTGAVNISGGNLTANTILMGSTAGGIGSLNVSGTANVIIGGGMKSSTTTVSGGSVTVLTSPPPPNEDPELNYAIVAGYLTSGSVSMSSGTITTPRLKLGITPNITGTYTQTGGTLIIADGAGTGAFDIGSDVLPLTAAGIGLASISSGTLIADSISIASTTGAVGSLTISSTAQVKTNALHIAQSGGQYLGTLDLTNGHLIVQASTNHAATLAALKAAVLYGTTHNTGILSSIHLSNQTVAVLDNADLNLTTFNGLPVDAGSIFLFVPYNGDANADGKVNIVDLNILANNWQLPAQSWTQADFDNSGTVNVVDLNILANNWQAGVGSSLPALSQLPITNYQSPTSPAPEPASLMLLAPCALLLASRTARRRRPKFLKLS